jgi:hypothetical protein
MLVEKLSSFEQCQRIEVIPHVQENDRSYKITVQRFDERLGWYTAGALSIPMHQLPLLEQALNQLRRADTSPCGDSQNIIPFPTLANPTA